MGYPMTWQRLVKRNRLTGDYQDRAPYVPGGERDDIADARCIIAGDMRRLERNSRDPRHLDAYSRKTGVSPEQVKAVLDCFFASDFPAFDYQRFPPDQWGQADAPTAAPDGSEEGA